MDLRVNGHQIIRIDREQVRTEQDIVVREVPLTIFWNGSELVTLLCTPESLQELAIGFLYSEGLIKSRADIAKLDFDEALGVIYAEGTRSSVIAEKLFLKRYITTGCGKGTTFFNAMDASLVKGLALSDNTSKFAAETIFAVSRELQTMSELFNQTGGVHGVVLAGSEGISIFKEDVGRHNATDKIIGQALLTDLSLSDKFLMTTGRISSEILLKAAKLGITLVASRSAPTDLAVSLAKEIGVTVVGFVRGKRMNIYAHEERVLY